MAAGDASEIAARVRAALAFANVQTSENRKPKGVGSISGPTLARIASAAKPRGVKDGELEQIAEACEGVPLAFLQAGWGPLAAPLSDTELAIRELRAQVRQLEGEVKRLAAADARRPPGELGRRAKGSATKGADQKPDAKKPAADAGKGTA